MNFHYSWRLKCTLRHSQISPFRKGCSSAAIGSWQHTALPASCIASRNAADGSVCVLASSTPCHSLHVTRSKTTADKPNQKQRSGGEAPPKAKQHKAYWAFHPYGVDKSSTNLPGWGESGAVTSVGWQITLCDPIDKWRPVALRWISRRTIRSFTFLYLLNADEIALNFVHKCQKQGWSSGADNH